MKRTARFLLGAAGKVKELLEIVIGPSSLNADWTGHGVVGILNNTYTIHVNNNLGP